jgi:HAMP domain-containing protein
MKKSTPNPETAGKRQGGIAKRLIISLTLGIFVVLSLVSTMQIYVAYERGHQVLEKDLQQYALMAAPTFSQPLWNVDLAQTYSNMNGLLQGGNVYGVLILDEKGNEFASLGSRLHQDKTATCNVSPPTSDITPTFDKNKCLSSAEQFTSATQRITNEDKLIGSITLYGNKDKASQLIQPLIFATLISAIVIMIALTLVSRWFIEKQVGIPLRSLTQHIRQLDYINISKTWTMSKIFTERKDELGELSKTFDDMVLKLSDYQDHLEEIVAERTEKLRIANAIKSDFLSHMSHEIRTPINGVLGLSEIMLSEIHTPETKHRLEMIHNSGNYLLKIVNDILDLSKIEAGKLHLESIAISLPNLANDVKSVFTNHAKREKVELSIVIAENTPKEPLNNR